MKHHCLLGHHWIGCRCEACGKVRDQDHPWNGCHCPRCGLIRHQGHDWELDGCRQHCRRCGSQGELSHDWNACACRRCGVVKHCWLGGVCAHCGERCGHPRTAVESDGFLSAVQSASGELSHARRVCQDCGLVLPGGIAHSP